MDHLVRGEASGSAARRTRRGTAIRVLQYDGQGFWLATN